MSDICAFHVQQKDMNQQFVVIANEQDFARRGLLLINLNYKGTPDAIRQKSHAISDFICHGLIDHDEAYGEAWSDYVINNTRSTLYPLRSFAMFMNNHCTNARMLSYHLKDALLSDKHASFMHRHRHFPPVLAQWKWPESTELKQLQEDRAEMDLNEDYYAVVGDGLMDDAEVEIVSVKSGKRWKWSFENFCDIMHYLTIGLITEEELSLPWKAQPELLRALSPDWLQVLRDDMVSEANESGSDGDSEDVRDEERFQDIRASGLYTEEELNGIYV
jgi:hypothetical protein